MDVLSLPINDLFIDDTFNCRGKLAPIDVKELAEDIKRNGQHQPVVVMKHNDSEMTATGKEYKLVAGFRRTYANVINGATHVPAVIKSHMTDLDARLLNLSENLKRQDLNILQEARALEQLYLAGLPREHVAVKVGKSSTWVQVRFALLQLPPDIQAEVSTGILTQQQIKKLVSLPISQQYVAVRKIKERLEKNERVDDLLARKKPKPSDRKLRTKAEIENMISGIMDQMGGTAVTRALAWAAGNISDMELYEDLQTFAQLVGRKFLTQVALITAERDKPPL